jgi:hypothetical protein
MRKPLVMKLSCFLEVNVMIIRREKMETWIQIKAIKKVS